MPLGHWMAIVSYEKKFHNFFPLSVIPFISSVLSIHIFFPKKRENLLWPQKCLVTCLKFICLSTLLPCCNGVLRKTWLFFCWEPWTYATTLTLSCRWSLSYRNQSTENKWSGFNVTRTYVMKKLRKRKVW